MNTLIVSVLIAFALVFILSDIAMAGHHYRHHDFGKVHTWDNGLTPHKYHGYGHGGYGYGGYGHGGYGGYGPFGGFGGGFYGR